MERRKLGGEKESEMPYPENQFPLNEDSSFLLNITESSSINTPDLLAKAFGSSLDEITLGEEVDDSSSSSLSTLRSSVSVRSIKGDMAMGMDSQKSIAKKYCLAQESREKAVKAVSKNPYIFQSMPAKENASGLGCGALQAKIQDGDFERSSKIQNKYR